MDDFESWSKLKRDIDSSTGNPLLIPKEGSVWLASLGKNIGFEQNGSGDDFIRPVLIVKKFNHSMAWAIPLSSKQKDIDFYFNYIDPKGHEVSAILAQLRLISLKRLRRKIYDLPCRIFVEVKIRLCSFLQ